MPADLGLLTRQVAMRLVLGLLAQGRSLLAGQIAAAAHSQQVPALSQRLHLWFHLV